ncbi:MAG: zinc-binding dehydrogenase [Candidatus Nealsonbacteria bacterium]|nr:zinc-binding dehydrogenase [Candidatus Nealsonbacteria bacterium]
MPLEVALSAIDISSLVPQVERLIEDKDRIFIMGCGKAGITAMAVIRQISPESIIYGIDFSEEHIEIARNLGYVDNIQKVDAQNAEAVNDFVTISMDGRGADLVLNCVNVPNTETSAILAARDRGTVVFFSMATKFDQAALGTDATGKDVTMIIGNGVAEGQSEKMFNLLRQDLKLRRYFENLHK